MGATKWNKERWPSHVCLQNNKNRKKKIKQNKTTINLKVKSDHRSKFSNLSNWKEEVWKISELQRDSNPWHPRHRCFTAQLVEHRTGVAVVTGSNPVEALIFFRLVPSNCLNWKIYCDDHSSLSSTTAVQYEFHIYFTTINLKATFSGTCLAKVEGTTGTIFRVPDKNWTHGSVTRLYFQWFVSESLSRKFGFFPHKTLHFLLKTWWYSDL